MFLLTIFLIVVAFFIGNKNLWTFSNLLNNQNMTFGDLSNFSYLIEYIRPNCFPFLENCEQQVISLNKETGQKSILVEGVHKAIPELSEYSELNMLGLDDGINNNKPVFSSDGKKLIFEVRSGSSKSIYSLGFYYFDVINKEFEKIDKYQYKSVDPCSSGFSPNGEKIFTISNKDGEESIEIFDLANNKIINAVQLNNGEILWGEPEEVVDSNCPNSVSLKWTDNKILEYSVYNKNNIIYWEKGWDNIFPIYEFLEKRILK